MYFWVDEVYGISPLAADDAARGPDCNILSHTPLALQYTNAPLIYMGLAVPYEVGGAIENVLLF